MNYKHMRNVFKPTSNDWNINKNNGSLLDLLWWSLCTEYVCQIIKLYTWNLNNVIYWVDLSKKVVFYIWTHLIKKYSC